MNIENIKRIKPITSHSVQCIIPFRWICELNSFKGVHQFTQVTSPPFLREDTAQSPSPVPAASGPIEVPPTSSAIQPQMAKNIAKARIKKKNAFWAAEETSCDGDLSLWDEWLRTQVECHKAKTELAKEQLLQLKSRPSAEYTIF
ncbi:hypothetical protein PoB_005805200 [Plakobranchus ocellatus]|uniref:Uncharacterized protein n=1 Tax=Plakobranchus ocellatus TaxID=259542 RepID=A0AAV4CJH3_9GAST|nr:hypothetical protein PoB_005805200 [Plakobranchus ocellatus]